MNAEQVGSFRTRTTGDGSLEVWARGWRLDSPLYALIPGGLALMFVLSPMPIPMRVVGAVVMLAATVFAFRLTKPGLLLSAESVTIVGVARTRRFEWGSVSGFMGERRHDEGRILLVLSDETRVPLPGTLDPGELDPYGEEGEALSAVDQLNRLGERARSGQTGPSVARPAEFIAAPAPAPEEPSKPNRRGERKQLKAALKAVRLPSDRRPTSAPSPEPAIDAASRRRPWRRKKEQDPAEELTKVAISEPEPAPARPMPEPASRPTAPASHYPTPTYIPQEEYARMLREQKAAEKAAAAAAAELSELADLDELAQKEEFSDWNE